MRHFLSTSVFFLVLFFTTLHASDNHWNIFHDDTIEASSFSSTEGLLSSIIANQVSAISGEYVDQELDCILPGPEPLTLQRTYSSNPAIGMFGYETFLSKPHDHKTGIRRCAWQFNHYTTLQCLSDPTKHKRHTKVSAFVPHIHFGQMLHRDLALEKEFENNPYSINLFHEKGVTNCASGAISGRTNPKNVKAIISDKEKTFDVTFGSGSRRHYKLTNSDKHRSVNLHKYAPSYEIKANGNQIIYENDHVYAYNPSRTTLFSWLKFNHISSREYQIESSHFDPITYSYKPFDVRRPQPGDSINRFYITSISQQNKPEVSYQYVHDVTREAMLLSRKEWPDQRFLEVDYYRIGDRPSTVPLFPGIHDGMDPRNNRVKCLKAPVGTDPTPIVTHQFFYDLSFRTKAEIKKFHSQKRKDGIDVHYADGPITKKVSTYAGNTTVYDAYGRKTVYSYNDDHRLKGFIQYVNNKPYLQTSYLWDETDNASEEFSDAPPINQCNLMGKLIRDGERNLIIGRYFDYDERGNILTERLYGHLSGTNDHPIKLDKNKYPLDNGTECYRKNYRYSNDQFNLLLEELSDNGSGIHYAYVPQTNLIRKKLLLEQNQVRAREFYEYDDNNVIVKLIRDNGSGGTRDNLSNVTERHITYYYPRQTMPVGLPERIDEMVLDITTGQEHLIKRLFQEFSKEGKLTKQEVHDSNGDYCYTKTWEYDKHGNLCKEVDPLGHTIIKSYDENDNLTGENYLDANCKIEYAYDFSDRLIRKEEYHSNGDCFYTHYQYDFVGNKISQIDRFANETHYRYDDLNRLIETIYPSINGESGQLTLTQKVSYDCMGNPTEETDVRGFVTRKTYNARGKVTSITHPDGQLERFEYALDGSLVKKIASNGTTTYFEIDCFGRTLKESVFSRAGELLYETSNTYDGLHKTSSTDVAGLITYYDYDLVGRLSKTTCGNKIEIHEYDALGRLSRKREPFEQNKEKVICTEYDFLDHVTEERIEDESGTILKKVTYQYDVWSNRTHVIEETRAGLSNHVTEYDADKRPVRTVDPDGNETHVSYNYAHRNELNQFVLQSITTDPVGRQTVITYDSREKPVSIQMRDPFGMLLKEQYMVYDEMGNTVRLVEHEILNGKEVRRIETTFDYQEMRQLTCIKRAKGLPEQQITHLKYNKFGQKESVEKADGIILHYEYDALGRLAHYYSSDHSLSYKYTYNVRNQVLKVKDRIRKTTSRLEYDERGRLITEKLANGIPIFYEYDQLDRAVVLKLPDSNQVKYQYDALNIKKVKRYKKRKLLYEHTYETHDLAGLNLKAKTINEEEIVYAYDRLKRPLSAENRTFKQTGMEYDCVGRLKQYHTQDRIGPLHIQFDFNEFDQLISEEGHHKHTYVCDSLHNRVAKDKVKSTFNGLNQLVWNGEYNFVYDRVGNLQKMQKWGEKTTYQYDADDRLIEVNSDKQTKYIYDAFHRRIAKVEGKRTTRYLYVGQDEIGSVDDEGRIQELRVLGQGHGAEIGASVAIELQDRIYVPSHDFQGNIVCLADLEGHVVETYRYTAFGETTIYNAAGEEVTHSEIGNPWQFSSKRFDEESGFVFFGRRYYDSKNGRWVTADPAGLIDGTNLYAYLHHSPLSAFDLYGLYEQAPERPGWTSITILEDIDYSDDGHQSYFENEFAPNKVPEDLHLKRKGPYGDSYCFGYFDNANIGFLYVHGIDNNHLEEPYKSAKQMSDDLGGIRVHFVHDQRKSVLHDLAECARGLYLHKKTDRVKNLEQEMEYLLSQYVVVFVRYHSGGGIVCRNYLEIAPREYRERMILNGYASAARINEAAVLESKQYASSRDFVWRLDIGGKLAGTGNIEVLRPHPKANWLDHAVSSETFRNQQIEDIQTAYQQHRGHQ